MNKLYSNKAKNQIQAAFSADDFQATNYFLIQESNGHWFHLYFGDGLIEKKRSNLPSGDEQKRPEANRYQPCWTK